MKRMMNKKVLGHIDTLAIFFGLQWKIFVQHTYVRRNYIC